MGRIYSVVLESAAVNTAQDFIEITAPADASVVLHEVVISNDDSETSEQLPFSIRRASVGGSGGWVAIPVSFLTGDPAFGGTTKVNNTSRATSSGMLYRKSENVLNGVHWLFTPETRPYISPSAILTIGLEKAPVGLLSISVTAVFEEVGG